MYDFPCWNSKLQYLFWLSLPVHSGSLKRIDYRNIRNRSVWHTLFLLNVFTALKGTHLYIFIHVWIPHGKIADIYFWFSLNYLRLLNYGPLTNIGMKFCKCRISKSIIARNLKLVSAERGWWIEYLMKNWKTFIWYFLSYCSFSKFLTLKFCNYHIPEWDIVLKLHVWIPHGK